MLFHRNEASLSLMYNYDQLYAYLSQHERHAKEVCITCERYLDTLALVANSSTLYNPSQSPQHTGSPVYPPPKKFTPVYAEPIHHHQHHTLVTPLQHLVSYQPYLSPSVTPQPQAEFSQVVSTLVVPMFQQGEDLIECINKAMAFLSAVASRPRNAARFKEKLMLAKAQEAGQVFDEEQLAFLADPGMDEALVSQQTIP
ncbi:hypothetical protein Tco_0618165 [Tanacetum coccineum]